MKAKLLGLVLPLLVIARFEGRADTLVSGTISTSTTWTLANSPYIVTGSVYVNGASSPVLTIQPGVTVKFNSSTWLMIGNGSPGGLQAVGTASQPIVFTANSANPAAGFWQGIRIQPAAVSASTQFSYVTVSYGGVTNQYGGIHVQNSSPTIQNATLQNNAFAGLAVNGGSPTVGSSTISGNPVGVYLWSPAAPTLQAVTVQNNTGFAATQDGNVTLGAGSTLTATGNGTNGIEIRGSAGNVIGGERTWRNVGLPYVVTSSVTVSNANSSQAMPTLTIEPGVTIKFNSGTYLSVGTKVYSTDSNTGKIVAAGTSSQPIVFTANSATPTAGFWGGIRLMDALTVGSQIAYATVSYGGVTNQYGGIHVQNCAPTIQNATLQNNAYAGLSSNGGSPTVSSSTISANPVGIYLSFPAAPTFQTVSLQNNTGFAATQDGNVTLGAGSSLAATGNGTNGIVIRAGNVNGGERTWRNTGLPYVVTGTITVSNANTSQASPTVTIEPGVTIKFNSGTYLSVGTKVYSTDSNTGKIVAAGTSSQPIVFTANSATPTAGFWGGIRLMDALTVGSQIAYATVSYGGVTNQYGGIHVQNCAPTIQNATLQNNAYAGLSSNGGSPTVSSSTISANPVGIYLSFPAAPTFQTVSLQNNTGFAATQDGNVTLGAGSSLTATGNGTNGIVIRAGNVNGGERTWRNTGLPYVVTGTITVSNANTSQASPTVTIEPGVTIKFNSGTYLSVGTKVYSTDSNTGKIVAAGTSSQPIVFTANSATPTAGFWGGIRLMDALTVGSQIAYATVSYGGVTNQYGGIHVQNCAPTIQNATLQNNAYAGLSISGGSPSIMSASIQNNNTAGILVTGGTPLISGSTIAGTVLAGGQGHGIDIRGGTATVLLTTMSNNAGAGVAVSGGGGHLVQNSVLAGNASGITNSSSTNYIFARLNYWNDATGPSGRGTGSGQSVSTGVVFDPWLTAPPSPVEYITYISSGKRFNPVVKPARWDLASSLSGTWQLTVRDGASSLIRTVNGTGTPVSMLWDGKNDAGVLQPDGTYNYILQATSSGGVAAAPAKGLLILDSTLNVAITWPGPSETVSNVYSNGARIFPVTGSVSMSGLTNWILEFGSGSTPASWTTIGTGTSPILNSTIATWNTVPVSNGTYTVRLSAFNSSQDLSTVTITPTLANFVASSDKFEFNPTVGESVSYASTVPFQVTEKLYMRDKVGQTVRTVMNEQRPAGSYVDSWNGLNDTGSVVPNGPHSFFIDVTDGTHSMTWDQTTDTTTLAAFQFFDGLNFSNPDPFNNRPITFSYQPNAPGRTTIFYSTVRPPGGSYTVNCTMPTVFCNPIREYQSSRLQTYRSAGVDSTGRYRSDVQGIYVSMEHDNFPKNLVVAYGSPAAISNLALSPSRTRPGIDSLQIDFDLIVPTGGTASVTISFLNQDSLSTLRTMTMSNQSGGHLTTSWDERADNGVTVAEGNYLVTVTATDSAGGQVSAQLLTVLED